MGDNKTNDDKVNGEKVATTGAATTTNNSTVQTAPEMSSSSPSKPKILKQYKSLILDR